MLLTALVFSIPVAAAAPAGPPYPPSPVVEKVIWAPADTIVRQAAGGDNWPLTWADDDAFDPP